MHVVVNIYVHILADFEVPSTREDVNSDSRWNQWLRDQIPHVFVNALQVFQVKATFYILSLKVLMLPFTSKY